MILRAGDVAEELERGRNGGGCRQVIHQLGRELRSGRELPDQFRVVGIVGGVQRRRGDQQRKGEFSHDSSNPFLKISAISVMICCALFPNGSGTPNRISSEK